MGFQRGKFLTSTLLVNGVVVIVSNPWSYFMFQVKDMSFYDVLLDFILLDAFDDLETPPYSVATAVQNRWLSARIKETVS